MFSPLSTSAPPATTDRLLARMNIRLLTPGRRPAEPQESKGQDRMSRESLGNPGALTPEAEKSAGKRLVTTA